MAGMLRGLVGRYCVASTRLRRGRAARGAVGERAEAPLSEATRQRRPWQMRRGQSRRREANRPAIGTVEVCALQASHDSGNPLGAKLMWGAATRQARYACWLALGTVSCGVEASSGRDGEGSAVLVLIVLLPRRRMRFSTPKIHQGLMDPILCRDHEPCSSSRLALHPARAQASSDYSVQLQTSRVHGLLENQLQQRGSTAAPN